MEKRRKRVHPWRDEYTREFGVRVVERDDNSGDVLLVECRFCAVFGREKRAAAAVDGAPTNQSNNSALPTATVVADATSSRKRPRARSRSVATWKKSFRSDNMRSHHMEQHPQKWAAYRRLLTLVKKEQVRQLAGRKDSGEAAPDDGATAVEDQLEAFFTPDECEVRETTTNRTVVAAAPRRAEQKTRRVEEGTCACGRMDSALVLTEISDPAIVDKVVTRLTEDSSSKDDVAAALSSSLLVPAFDGNPSSSAPSQDIVKYKIALPSERAFSFCRQVLALDDATTFKQLASILNIARGHCIHFGTKNSADVTTSNAETREYGRLIVAMDLQMLASIMRASWTYSLVLRNIRVSGTPGEASVLEVRLRVISSRSNADMNEFHVLAVPLQRQFEAAVDPRPQACAAFVRDTLSVLDPQWRRKVLGGWVGGCLANFESASTVVDRIVNEVATTAPFYEIWYGALFVGRAVQQALQELIDGDGDDDEAIGFATTMERALAYLRTQDSWIQSHGSEFPGPTNSALWTGDACKADASPWQLLETLQWFVARREAIGQLYMETNPPPRVRLTFEWWLVCLALTDLLSGYASTANALWKEKVTQPGSATIGRKLLAEFVHSQIEKLGLVASKEPQPNENPEDSSVSHETTQEDEDSDVQRGHLRWPIAKIVAFFRSLNLSTRRLYTQLSVNEQHSVQRQIGRFVVHALGSMSQSSERSTRPSHQEKVDEGAVLLPVRPLDFVAIERDAVVDFIEHHSARLEVSYGMASIDAITNEIKELRDVVAADANLKAALLAATASSSSLHDAWKPVHPRFQRVRTLAAGFATTIPTALTSSKDLSKNDLDPQWPRASGSNHQLLPLLSTEARLHARQLAEMERGYKTYQ
ncbi:hypothetical protein FI667_g4, partial [Globisporangium splendens]